MKMVIGKIGVEIALLADATLHNNEHVVVSMPHVSKVQKTNCFCYVVTNIETTELHKNGISRI